MVNKMSTQCGIIFNVAHYEHFEVGVNVHAGQSSCI